MQTASGDVRCDHPADLTLTEAEQKTFALRLAEVAVIFVNAVSGSLKLTGEVPPIRVLVCAQSNAAVDELVERLGTQGLFAAGSNGSQCRIPAMVRMGKMESATSAAQWFQIDAVAAAHDEQAGQAQGDRLYFIAFTREISLFLCLHISSPDTNLCKLSSLKWHDVIITGPGSSSLSRLMMCLV